MPYTVIVLLILVFESFNIIPVGSFILESTRPTPSQQSQSHSSIRTVERQPLQSRALQEISLHAANKSLIHNIHELILNQLVNSSGGQNFVESRKKIQVGSRRKLNNKRPGIKKLEYFERVPSWPVSNGLGFRAISRVNRNLAAHLEDRAGGMYCPNAWINNPDTVRHTSPFLMLVHHNHSFDLSDPARILQKSLLPEGFPAHAHRGMVSVTICLRGGLIHRDSLGIKQIFGADTNDYNNRYGGKHTQWLTFGRGIVHELMWDNEKNRNVFFKRDNILHQEIYQIWIDLPTKDRMAEPRVEILGGQDETPIVSSSDGKTQTTVIAGKFNDKAVASVILTSQLAILHVVMEAKAFWTYATDLSNVIIYMRKGSVSVGGVSISPHCTAYLEPVDSNIVVKTESGSADFLVLAGQPLKQQVSARGPMVMDTPEEVDSSFRDYEDGLMGIPWNEKLTDDEWRAHLSEQG